MPGTPSVLLDAGQLSAYGERLDVSPDGERFPFSSIPTMDATRLFDRHREREILARLGWR